MSDFKYKLCRLNAKRVTLVCFLFSSQIAEQTTTATQNITFPLLFFTQAVLFFENDHYWFKCLPIRSTLQAKALLYFRELLVFLCVFLNI